MVNMFRPHDGGVVSQSATPAQITFGIMYVWDTKGNPIHTGVG